MNMPEVLTYALGPLPWSLATAEGAPTKTATSALLHTLEEKAQPFEDVPASAVWILDGVDILHSMKDVPRTFSCIASYVFQLVKSAASQDRTRTDLIMDQYPDVSTTNPERPLARSLRSAHFIQLITILPTIQALVPTFSLRSFMLLLSTLFRPYTDYPPYPVVFAYL